MTTETRVSEFFTAGGTLPPDAPSYVKRSTDDELFRHVMAGEFCYVLTPRQMGKSSLMIRTAKRLSNEGVKSAIVDLTQIGTVQSEDQWYKGILTQIARRLRLTVNPVIWWEQRKDIPNIQKFIEFFEETLSEVKEPVVIFMDEIDTTLKLDFRDNFFAGVRAIFNARAENPDLKRITFVLLGVASPSDLIKDRNRTPFNIGQEIPLRPFSREDARMLEKGLNEAYPNFGQKILDRVFYWTNGHPYLTQKICQGVVEIRLDEYDDDKIDKLVEKLFITEEASRETNLQFVRDNILNYPERRVILSLYKKLLRKREVHDNKNSLPQNHLKLSGLARAEDGRLVVSNKIYRTVFDHRWVNKYTEVDWRSFVIGALSLIVIAFSSVFYYDGVRLPNQAATKVYSIPIYRDYTGIQFMAELFRMDPFIFRDEYEDRAKDTFFNLLSSWEDQRSLIEIGYREARPSQKDYRTVITGLYTSLADVDDSGDTTKLLDVMYKSLHEMEMQDESICKEIGYWLEARKNEGEKNFQGALENYNDAVSLNSQNPATLFERARIYTQLLEYEKASDDYEEVIIISLKSASVSTSTPLPTHTETPTKTPTLPATSSPTLTPAVPPTLMFTQTPGIRSTFTPSFQRPTITALSPTLITPAILTDSPSVTPIFTPTTLPEPVQSRFSNSEQRFTAVRSEISKHNDLLLFLLQNQDQYPNLVDNGMVPTLTPTPTNTQTSVSSVPPSTATPTFASSITPSPVPQSSILLQEDFEDGKADGWGRAIDTDYVGNWSIEEETNGNHFWSGTGPTNYPQNWYGDANLNWSDYAFESRIQFVTGGTLFICIRSNGGTAFYTVYINDTSINYAEANRLKGVEFASVDGGTPNTFVRNRWYTIRVEIKGNTLSTYVDNVLVRARELPSPTLNTQGGIGYYMGGGEKFYIDDIRVWSLNESQPATSTPVPIPSRETTKLGGGTGQIFFNCDADIICVMNADGSGQTPLTNGGGHLAVSPDGKLIAVSFYADHQIYVMNADGSGLMRLTNNQVSEEPDWSPDGTRIIFQSNRDNDNEIYIMNADGTEQTQLTFNSADDKSAAWSPDGKQIAFISNRDGDPELYVMNSDGTDQTQFTFNSADDAFPDWSPDSEQIVFDSNGDGNYELYTMNADGTGLIRVTSNSVDDDYPAWSPDGMWIVFDSHRDGNWEIYIMKADGTEQKRLTSNSVPDYGPAWQP